MTDETTMMTPRHGNVFPLRGRSVNTLRPRQNGRHFADDIFKCIFLNENVLIPIKISLKFVPKGPINNIPALVLIMAWRRPGHKPLSEPMMASLPTHICVTRRQWVNVSFVVSLKNMWNNLSLFQWFETPWLSYDVTAMLLLDWWYSVSRFDFI